MARCLKRGEKIILEQGLKSSFAGHPDGRRFEKATQRIAGSKVAEFVLERSNGSEQRLVQFGEGGQPCLSGDVSPRAFCSVAHDLLIAGILFRRLPGKPARNADKRMEDHERGLETAAIGFEKRRVIGRVNQAFKLHPARITKRDRIECAGMHRTSRNERIG